MTIFCKLFTIWQLHARGVFTNQCIPLFTQQHQVSSKCIFLALVPIVVLVQFECFQRNRVILRSEPKKRVALQTLWSVSGHDQAKKSVDSLSGCLTFLGRLLLQTRLPNTLATRNIAKMVRELSHPLRRQRVIYCGMTTALIPRGV